jgi:hypothetical protein
MSASAAEITPLKIIRPELGGFKLVDSATYTEYIKTGEGWGIRLSGHFGDYVEPALPIPPHVLEAYEHWSANR